MEQQGVQCRPSFAKYNGTDDSAIENNSQDTKYPGHHNSTDKVCLQ